jgi:hypothetical protein
MLNSLKRLWHKCWDATIDDAGEELGKLEDVTHSSWYAIKPYCEVVDPGKLLRGSWPDANMLRQLKAAGVRAVLNLCEERQQNNEVAAAGMTPCNLNLSDNCAPNNLQVDIFLSAVRELSPMYVHCEQGIGRTGCMVAAYRVRVQGWTPEAAVNEACAHGLKMPCQQEWIRGLRKTRSHTRE